MLGVDVPVWDGVTEDVEVADGEGVPLGVLAGVPAGVLAGVPPGVD